MAAAPASVPARTEGAQTAAPRAAPIATARARAQDTAAATLLLPRPSTPVRAAEGRAQPPSVARLGETAGAAPVLLAVPDAPCGAPPLAVGLGQRDGLLGTPTSTAPDAATAARDARAVAGPPCGPNLCALGNRRLLAAIPVFEHRYSLFSGDGLQ